MFTSISYLKQSEKITTITFSNIENLFDPFNNPTTAYNDFTQKKTNEPLDVTKLKSRNWIL